MTSRSVILVGTNTKKYLNFALSCAASIQLHNPELPIFIATNIIPQKKYKGIHFIKVEEHIAKLFIETKLYLDTFLQTDETLYIDSDMLCFGDLTPIFDACKEMDVTVLGKLHPIEDYWGDQADFARKEFGIDHSILFNGGLYFLKKTELTTKIFNKARKISEHYDEYGFGRIHNNWKNEEDMVSIGMISNQQLPIDDDGQFVAGFSTEKPPKKFNVLKGIMTFNYNSAAALKTKEHPIKPVLFHFGGENMYSPLYIAQNTLLKLHKWNIPVQLGSLVVALGINMPFSIMRYIKQKLSKLAKN